MKNTLLTISVLLFAAFFHLSALDIPYSKEAPVLDGQFGDACWASLPWNSGFTLLGTKEPVTEETRFKTFHDGNYLYLAIEAMESDMAHLVATEYSEGSTTIWRNDSIEIGYTHDPGCVQFYKLMIDCKGTTCDLLYIDNNTGTDTFNISQEWKSSIQFKTARGDKSWALEIAIPFGSMDFTPGEPLAWRMNIARNRFAGSKKAELSSWEPVPKRSLPKTFPLVNLLSFNPTKYLLDFGKYTMDFVKNAEGKYDLTATIEVHNHTGSFKILQTRLTENTLPPRTSENRQALGSDQFANLKVTLPDAVPGEYLVDLALYSSGKPVLLKQITRKETLQYKSVATKLLRPSYRNNLYATMPDKTIEAIITLKEGIGSPLKIELAGPKQTLEQSIPAAAAENHVTFDGSKLEDGTYILRSTIQVEGRNVTDEFPIRKLPYQKGEIWLDKHGVTYIDGEKTLPFGWYGDYDGPKYPWVNNMLLLTKFRSPEDAVFAVQQYRKDNPNIRVMLVPFQDLNPKGWAPPKIFAFETMKKSLSKEQKEKITEFITKASKADGILGWYMADEPEGRDLNPAWYEEARNLIAELDPYHPCFLLNYGTGGIRKFYKGADILIPDCYPQYFQDNTTTKPRWSPSEWAKTSTALRPAWQMPQGCLWPAGNEERKGVPPDYHDQRSELFQAFIHNVKGINYYAWYLAAKYSQFLVATKANGQTLALLKDYLLEDSVPGGITAKVTPSVPAFQAGVKYWQGKPCVIAVNTSLQNIKAEFTMKNGFTGTLFVAGEHRSVSVKNGTFSDDFAPKATHIYLADEKLAEAVPGVPETEKVLQEHLDSRRKNGNLIAVGQMLDVDYWNYGRKKLAPGVPDIQVSSDATFWGTRLVGGSGFSFHLNGSRYFMVDGLTEPERSEYSWAPTDKDKNPWMEITLSDKAPVKEVRLYTPNGNLQSCRITDDAGNTITAENKEKNQIFSIPFPGKTIQKIKIEFLHFEYSEGKLGKRLLTEVEIY